MLAVVHEGDEVNADRLTPCQRQPENAVLRTKRFHSLRY